MFLLKQWLIQVGWLLALSISAEPSRPSVLPCWQVYALFVPALKDPALIPNGGALGQNFLFNIAVGDEVFKDFLIAHGTNFPERRTDVIKRYAEYLSYLHQKGLFHDLHQLQDEALAKELQKHGYPLGSGSGRKDLEVLSAVNFHRLMPSDYRSNPEMAEAERLVENLEISFEHNTIFKRRFNDSPLFSSASLEKLTNKRAGENTYPFNKDFLGSNDNVFFFVRFHRKGDGAQRASIFGKNSIFVDPGYASRVGLISGFVMDPKDLIQVSRYSSPDSYKTIVEQLPKGDLNEDELLMKFSSGRSWERDPIFIKEREVFTRMRNSLHKLDFTVEDFTLLARRRLLISLDEIRINNPQKFGRILEILRTGTSVEIDELVARLAFQPLGFPGEFEFKIPVGVPAEHLSGGSP